MYAYNSSYDFTASASRRKDKELPTIQHDFKMIHRKEVHLVGLIDVEYGNVDEKCVLIS
jgi:hypothetical protein